MDDEKKRLNFSFWKWILSIITIFVPLDVLESIMTKAGYYAQRATRITFDAILDALGIFYLPKRNRLPPITDPLLMQSATDLLPQIRSGKLKSERLVRAFIDRIKEVNPLINAVVYDRFEDAIKESKEYDRRIEAALKNPDGEDSKVLKLPLLGLPMTIKESIAVKGMPCSAGLYSRKDLRITDEEESPCVKNLRKSGAIILGVTNIPEFLLWWDTNNRLYGRANNPYDLSRITGGSSGGEAAISSAGGSIIGLGSDIGGSIRIPTFFCGVFGHKPSSHVTSNEGSYPYCGHPNREKFLVVGPICRYAIDLKPVFKQIIGDDTKTLAELDLDRPVDLKKSKFYFMYEDGDPFKTPVSKDVKDGLVKVRTFLEKNCGFDCRDVDLPLMRYNFFIWLSTIADCDAPPLAEEVMERKGRLNGFTELIKSFFGLSKFRKITCLNVIGENMVFSQKTRERSYFRKIVEMGDILKKEIYAMLDDDSVLIMPCLPEKPPKHNGTFLRMNNCGYTAIWNILETPVTMVTVGLGQDSKMPVGIQVVAKRLNDRITLAVAELLAKEFGGWRPPCQVEIDSSKE